ncbi:hypothetical protein HZA43_02870 [Candidatus Peregrinibacteria bacterium]|nr:hypothetical protein [Candidatus Peregrinibacteria bacterium]
MKRNFFIAMSLTPHQIKCKEELESYGLTPKRELSQTFLVDPKGVERLINGIKKVYRPNTKIVEIGGGMGYITEALAKNFPKVEVLEIDPAMIKILKVKTQNFASISLLKKDFRRYTSKEPYMLVGSIPFHLTSVFLKQFLWDAKNKPYALSLIIDRQYARTLMNPPPRSYRISVLAQTFGALEIVADIPKEMAYPQPNIIAAVINMVQEKKYNLPKNFWKIVHYHFDHFPTPEVESPKTMSIEQWIALCKSDERREKTCNSLLVSIGSSLITRH